ncbi:MAG TPA: GNAT family N-acetyltransferase [Candidatus Lokiarchaeia archaeon]
MDITIKRLEPRLLDDFLLFFDQIGFVDNKDWERCYCQFYQCNCGDDLWLKRSKEENRTASIELILNGKMSGFLAYSGNKPVGWCNVGQKNNYPRLLLRPNIKTLNDDKFVSIVCFLIAPDFRRQGIARKFLRKAINLFKDQDFQYLEAYPRKGKLSNANHYHGPLSLYTSEGFTMYKEYEEFFIVRKNLF